LEKEDQLIFKILEDIPPDLAGFMRVDTITQNLPLSFILDP
jgi:hypothetical protein